MAAHVERDVQAWPAEGAIERLERLDRLDRQDRRDREEARERQEAARSAAAVAAALHAQGAADRMVAAGAALLKELVGMGQGHLVDGWQPGEDEEDKRRLFAQLHALDASITGGLVGYVRRAATLLKESQEGKNPLEGFAPAVPSGHELQLGGPDFLECEATGAAARCGFVVVAGGLGERLGYSGIKLELPPETLTGKPYLQLYAEHVLALQRQQRRTDPNSPLLPLIIMTSEDTDLPTRALIDHLDGMGLDPAQLHVLRQQKVPCLVDSTARLATLPSDRYTLLTKPHGHGDVHALLHSSGLAARLYGEGFTHLAFLQDTNALVFSGLVAAIGLSVRHGLALNTLSVPRRAGDAAGALMQLTGGDGRSILCNVEYNQLSAMLVAAGDSRGDTNDTSGYSPYPGNTNQLVVALELYVASLEASGGVMVEFVNPKYTDATRTAFKSPTRLECMMQDLPWLLPPGAPVSFTVLGAADAYAPVKNALADAAKKAAAGQSPGAASSAEFLVYALNAKLLRLAGAEVEQGSPCSLAGVPCSLGPQVVLTPAFRPTIGAALSRLQGTLRVSARSSLLLDGEIHISHLELDGALKVRAAPGARVTIRRMHLTNKGYVLRELSAAELTDPATSELCRMRGFTYEEAEVREMIFDEPGEHVVDEE